MGRCQGFRLVKALMDLEVLNDNSESEVGSYFVANYPPFSVWSKSENEAAIEALNAPAPVDSHGHTAPLGLYLHIPFCRKRCHFCYFRVYTGKNSKEIEEYLDALATEAALYSDRAALQGREFDFVYFGGGTPSYLSGDQLKRLIARIGERWKWDHAREVTFECEPGTLRKGKLEAIKAIGVTRLSMGVEHFDDEILERGGRAHKSAEVFRAYEWAREVGFPQINVDLIAGMIGETQAKWEDAISKTIALDPDSITIYQMEIPHNTDIAREIKNDGPLIPIASWDQRRAWADEALCALESAGYEINGAYTAVRPDRNAGFIYRDALWRGADMIGTGVASFSHLSGVHYQNADQWESYAGPLRAGKLPLQRALRLSDRERLTREVVLQLKLGEIPVDYFERKFDENILRVFAEPLVSLENEGFATISPERVSLTRKGLLRIDALLPRFFDPKYTDIRYT